MFGPMLIAFSLDLASLSSNFTALDVVLRAG